MIEWLNENAGAVQGAATLALVLITLWYVLLTRAIVQATRRSQRPYVYLDITGEGGPAVELAVANYGDRAAEDIQFDVVRDVRQQGANASVLSRRSLLESRTCPPVGLIVGCSPCRTRCTNGEGTRPCWRWPSSTGTSAARSRTARRSTSRRSTAYS